MPIEITTYRIDGEYSNNRHPDQVSFTNTIEADLARRDFTMNAIAYHPEKGFIDPFNGCVDIQRKTIKAVGVAQKRFEEDALRILRALRFAATLGFTIESQTLQAMHNSKKHLHCVSAERIYNEFSKALLGQSVKASFTHSPSLWGMVIPELLPMVGFAQNTPYHMYDVFTHTLVAVEHTPAILYLRIAAFFHDIGKPETYTVDEKGIGHFYGHPAESVRIAETVLNRLKCDKQTKTNVLTLIKYHDTPIEPKRKDIKRWLAKITPDLFFDLLQIKRADNLAKSTHFHIPQKTFDTIKNIAQDIIVSQECFTIRDLAINGNDVINAGYHGQEIGGILQYLLDGVIDGDFENDKSALLHTLQHRYSSQSHDK